MYEDIYWGMNIIIDEHPNELYNGEYVALDYLITGRKYVHFINENQMYLYFFSVDENGSSGLWFFNDFETLHIEHNGGYIFCSQ